MLERPVAAQAANLALAALRHALAVYIIRCNCWDDRHGVVDNVRVLLSYTNMCWQLTYPAERYCKLLMF